MTASPVARCGDGMGRHCHACRDKREEPAQHIELKHPCHDLRRADECTGRKYVVGRYQHAPTAKSVDPHPGRGRSSYL